MRGTRLFVFCLIGVLFLGEVFAGTREEAKKAIFEYFPLKQGVAWDFQALTYQPKSRTPQKGGNLTWKISKIEGSGDSTKYYIQLGDTEPFYYTITKEGLVDSSGDLFLKLPLISGNKWKTKRGSYALKSGSLYNVGFGRMQTLALEIIKSDSKEIERYEFSKRYGLSQSSFTQKNGVKMEFELRGYYISPRRRGGTLYAYADKKPAPVVKKPKVDRVALKIEAYKKEEAGFDSKLNKQAENVRKFMKDKLDANYTTSRSMDNAWDAWKKKFKSGSVLDNYYIDHNINLTSFGDKKEEIKKLHNELKNKRKALASQISKEARKNKRLLALKLSRLSTKINDPLNAKWFLGEIYKVDSTKEDSELNNMVPEACKKYDESLVLKFRKNGGYGKFGSDDGCVFSRKPFPKNPGKTVKPIFSTYFKGPGKLYVLCRLPRPAKNYSGYMNGMIHLQLISDSSGFQIITERKTIGSPKTLGNTDYITAEFTLPPPKFENNVRWTFSGQAVLTFNKPLYKDDFSLILTKPGSFFWHK